MKPQNPKSTNQGFLEIALYKIFRNRKVIVGRWFHFPWFIEHEFDFKEMFDFQGWFAFVGMKVDVFPYFWLN